MEVHMSVIPVPVRPAPPIRVPALAWIAVAFAIGVLYLILQENGALLTRSWETLHEFFHDGRHLLGVPCH
jgi:hypothetical protein